MSGAFRWDSDKEGDHEDKKLSVNETIHGKEALCTLLTVMATSCKWSKYSIISRSRPLMVKLYQVLFTGWQPWTWEVR